MSAPSIGCTYTGEIYNISHTGNPLVQKDYWADPVVVLTDDGSNYSEGDQFEGLW